MGKSSGVRKNLANYSANHRRSSGMIFLSNLQKVSASFFSKHTIYWKNNKSLKPERKMKIGGEERNIIFQQIK